MTLTVIAHPDGRRVGQVAALTSSNASREGDLLRWHVSRTRLPFAHPYVDHTTAEVLGKPCRSFVGFVSDTRQLCIEARITDSDWLLRIFLTSRDERACACMLGNSSYHTLYGTRAGPEAHVPPATNSLSEGELCRWLPPLHAPREFQRSDLEQGIVLLYSKHIGLLLQLQSRFDDKDAELSRRFAALCGRPLGHQIFSGLVGESDRMRKVRRDIEASSASAQPVLVLGETGTGKEPVAEALHLLSQRSGAWSSHNMRIAAEDPAFHLATLFGRVDPTRVGLLEQSHRGTLFLDEIGDAPAEVQGSLLTYLSNGCFRPLGGSRDNRVDTRIVAATNKEPRQLLFDLLPRLNKLTIRLPPLRERRDDVGRLLYHFLHETLRKWDNEARVESPRKRWVDFLDEPQAPGPWLSAEIVCVIASLALRNNVRDLQLATERLLLRLRMQQYDPCDLVNCAELLRDLVDSEKTSGREESSSHPDYRGAGRSSFSELSGTGLPSNVVDNDDNCPEQDELSSRVGLTSLDAIGDAELLEQLRRAGYVESRLQKQLGLQSRRVLRERLRQIGFRRFGDRTAEDVLEQLKQLQPGGSDQGPGLLEVTKTLNVNPKDLKGWLTKHAGRVRRELPIRWIKALYPEWKIPE